MMAAVWFRARADLRARWRAWVAMGLLVGIAGGAAIAAAAGARRTESAYPRFLVEQRAMDALVDVRDQKTGVPVPLEKVLELPSIEDASTALALFSSDLTTESGRRLVFPDVFTVVSSDGRFSRDINVSKILQGRRPDPARDDEALVGFTVAERFGIDVGDRLHLQMFSFDAPTEPLAEHDLHVVGIGALPGEFQALAGASLPSVNLTPAFFDRFEDTLQADPAFAVRFRGGVKAIPDFEREAQARGYFPTAFFRQPTQTSSVRRSTRFNAFGLWLLGGLTAIATIAILGQALARQASLEADEYPALRALGLSRGQLVAVGAVRSLVIAASGAFVAAVIAIAASPLTPAGLARIAEPDPGIAVDAVAIGIGTGAIVALVAVVSALAQWRAARRDGAQAAPVAERPSFFSERIARAGAPAPMVAGSRLALESGRGRTAVPVRSTILGVALGVLALTSALTFGSSMDHLVRTPALSGWTFDLLAGASPTDISGFERELDSQGLIRARSSGYVDSLTVGGKSFLEASLILSPGSIGPAIAEGREPRASDEVVLGRETMRQNGVKIGETVDVAVVDSPGEGPPVAREPHRLRVVGRLVQPAIGFNLSSSGEGAAITTEAYERMGGTTDPTDRANFYRLRSETDVRRVIEQIGPKYPSLYLSGRRESSAAADVSRLEGIPLILAGILGLMAVSTMVHTLVTSIRRRARDLAILRTIGFVGRQVRATVAWQATVLVLAALAIGVPIGVVLGRWGWLAFADTLGVVPVVVAPVLALTLAVPIVLATANLVAALPARAAARTQPAVVLRTE